VFAVLGKELNMEMWIKRLTYGGTWEVVNESGEVMAASLSSTDVASEARAEAERRGVAMIIVTEVAK
jgi:hypothetical protein